jgi:hypothetical protein
MKRRPISRISIITDTREGGAMNKGDLTCSLAMAKLLATVPEDADIGSVAVFVGVKGGGVYMGAHMDANPVQIASMISAFSEAKRSVLEGIIREHGMDTLVSVMFFLAGSTANTKELGSDPSDFYKQYFVPKSGDEE